MNIYLLADKIEEEKINTVTFPKNDIFAIYNLLSVNLSKGMKVLEIGSWKGASSIVIAKTIEECNGTLVCVDTWKGTHGDEYLQNEVSEKNIFEIFRENLYGFDINNVIPIIGDSSYIVNFQDTIKFDFIFIDGDHRYTPTFNDISNSLKLLKNGGVICGHDCVNKFTNYPIKEQYEIIEEKENPNWIASGMGPDKCCGVIYALYRIFNDKYNLIYDSLLWWKHVWKHV